MSGDAEQAAAGPDGRRARRTRTAAAARGGGPRRDLMESQIMEAATRLFADRGFAGTSLQDIADATGLTRPALYHYFGSKEDLLSRLVSELTEGPADELGEIRARTPATATERLRAMAFAVALRQATQPARFRVLVRSEAELPGALSKVYDQGRRRVLKEFSSVIDEGVRQGEFRPVDPRVAALGVIGLCNWVAWWHRPGDQRADQGVAEALADMAVASVVQRDVRVTEAGGAARVLALLKEDVALLERFLDE
jgi:AcrR family transcriptional regulator